MKKITQCLLLSSILYLASCSKSNDSNNNNGTTDNGSTGGGTTSTTTGYSGKYVGTTAQRVTTGGSSSSQSYEMVIDVAKGDNDQEIKLLFGVWVTKAVLNGAKFTINETSFSGPVVITGSGEFLSGNKVSIAYNVRSFNTQTTNYTGTLSKF